MFVAGGVTVAVDEIDGTMVTITEPMLNAAHGHSMDNRSVLSTGGVCGYFHCLNVFDASDV